MLLIGFLLKKRREAHIILLLGWILFGIFWLTQIPHFFEIGDDFNAIFSFMGFVLFSYFAYHELLNYNWKEYLFSLNYIAGIVAVGGLFYYSIEKIEPLAKGLIYIVASQSVWLVRLFGIDATLGNFGFNTSLREYYLNLPGTEYDSILISIVLACTGIQSIAIFIGILKVTRSKRKIWEPSLVRFLKEKTPKEIKASTFRTKLWNWKKARMKKVQKMSDRGRFIRVFMYTVPVIYVLNIFRNALIIYGHVNAVLGPNTYNIAHNILSKFLSLGVLIIMVFIVFELLPEFREGILGLIDLQYRDKKGLVKDDFIDLDKVEAEFKKKDKQKKRKNMGKKPVEKKIEKNIRNNSFSVIINNSST